MIVEFLQNASEIICYFREYTLFDSPSSLVTNYAYNQVFLTCLLSRSYREISRQTLPWQFYHFICEILN